MLLSVVVFVFFFKQKTAYEMRISDWSSDVCSSDLRAPLTHGDGNRWLHMASLPDHRTAELWAHGKAGATVPPDSARVAAARQAGAGCGTGRRCKYLRRFSVT